MKIETQCLHAGYEPKNGETHVLPIYQSTTYDYDSTEFVGKLFDLTAPGHMYSRISNPTVDAVEQKIAALEGGVGAITPDAEITARVIFHGDNSNLFIIPVIGHLVVGAHFHFNVERGRCHLLLRVIYHIAVPAGFRPCVENAHQIVLKAETQFVSAVLDMFIVRRSKVKDYLCIRQRVIHRNIRLKGKCLPRRHIGVGQGPESLGIVRQDLISVRRFQPGTHAVDKGQIRVQG